LADSASCSSACKGGSPRRAILAALPRPGGVLAEEIAGEEVSDGTGAKGPRAAIPLRCPARPLARGVRPFEPRPSAIFFGKKIGIWARSDYPDAQNWRHPENVG
jgi:hypothetical protein